MNRSYFNQFRIFPAIALVLALALCTTAPVSAAEPNIADYTKYPVFLSQSITPNIMIILDNSGSMNEPAYKVGDPYLICGVSEVHASANRDDAEEIWGSWGTDGSSYSNSGDLDISALDDGHTQPILIGVRFPAAGIPQGAAITKAEVRFTAISNQTTATTVTIVGIEEENTDQFRNAGWQPSDGSFDIKNRPETSNTVTWNIPNWTSGTRNAATTTPDLTAIVQEIVNQPGWTTNSALGIKLLPVSGKRDAYSADNSSDREPVLYVEYTPTEDCYQYYGYFDPNTRYSYSSGKFIKDTNGPWNGDWLNWLTMRKVDVVRKVMMGGLATARTGGGNQTNYGEQSGWGNRVYYKWFNNPSSTTGVSPYAGNVQYKMENGYIYVGGTSYRIAVEKDITNEPQDFYEGNLAGVLQKVGDKARWGNMWFYTGTGTNREGGFVSNRIGTNLTTLVTDLQNTPATTWTPLAETYYICTQYFKQQKQQSGLGYSNNAVGPLNLTNDPYYESDWLECAKSFVILLTDGASTKDTRIPFSLQDYDGDGDWKGCSESSCTYPSAGSDYLDDLALYARTTDLRSDLAGDQNLILYTIYAFGQDDNARNLLKDAARNGGFEDKNGNNRPDGDYTDPADDRVEWDEDGDGNPDTYFEADNGYLLESQLLKAITDILRRASSGTAVSVLATSSEGEGTLVQAYFKPSVSEGTGETTWVGFLQSLWVDSLGRTREDNYKPVTEPGLQLTEDNIIEFFFDKNDGQAKFNRFELDTNGDKLRNWTDTNGNGVFDDGEPYIDMNGNNQWDTGETFTDLDGDGILDAPEAYNDQNGNGVWDVGESFTDLDGDGVWDAAEGFDDFNGNGILDAAPEPCSGGLVGGVCPTGEPFTDNNGDCVWNAAEPYTDTNGNGLYDPELNEPFTDSNGNLVWDDEEPYTDADTSGTYTAGNFVPATDDLNGDCIWNDTETFDDANLNGVWDDEEPWTDSNGNGMYDGPETWVDENGNGTWDDGEAWVDTNGNGYFDETEPYTDLNGDGSWTAGDDFSYVYSEHNMDELQSIWEGGNVLGNRAASTRVIKTFVDQNNDGVVDSGEIIDFNETNADTIKPYLGVHDDFTWSYLGATKDDRVKNVIRFTRGESTGYTGLSDPLRYRQLNGMFWKLGDIIHSTPVTVGKPADNYGIIYGDQSYQAYYQQYVNREQVVYVGSNTGMLHAFFLGKLNQGDSSATATDKEQIYFSKETTTSENYGDELWSFIPQSLLPHLKWLPDPEYTHVYFVDLKPKIVDAKIFTADATHPNGWGTVLLGGLRFGGKDIWSTDIFPEGNVTRNFGSSFFAIDVTDPHNPVVLWEKTFPNIGLTTSNPTVAKVKDTWFALVGSGPTTYEGSSAQKAHIYVMNLYTGELLRDYETAESGSFAGAGPVTVDIGLNYNVDTGFIGTTYESGSNWKGKLYRFRVPKITGDFRVPSATDVYDDDPANWVFSKMMDVDGAITASPGVSIDTLDNLWVYFGTGRFYADADKVDKDQQYFYGVKDPYYNAAMYPFKTDADGVVLDSGDLLNSTDITIYSDKTVADAPSPILNWTQLLNYMKAKDGWYFLLGQEVNSQGERVINKPSVLGGVVFDTTFVPNQDPCGFEGDSYILGAYYETGTAYVDEVFVGGSTEEIVGGETKRAISRSAYIGTGRSSNVSIHVGKQEGATGFVQQSTGIVHAVTLNPAFKIRSGFIYWRER